MEKYIEDTPALNTDDNVWLEHRMPYDFFNVKTGDLGPELIRRFAKRRMAGLRELAPGMPEEEAVRTMIHYLYSQEPMVVDKHIHDHWRQRRAQIMDGFQSTFEEEGDTEMVEKVRAWREDAEAYHKARVLAMRHVSKTLDARVQQQPSLRNAFMEEALAKAPDLPVALIMAGKFAMQDQENTKAEEHFLRALEYPWSRAYYDAALGLADLKEREKQPEEALAYAKLAEKKNP